MPSERVLVTIWSRSSKRLSAARLPTGASGSGPAGRAASIAVIPRHERRTRPPAAVAERGLLKVRHDRQCDHLGGWSHLAVGERYLVSGEEHFAWACGFTQPYDAAVAAEWAAATGG